MGQYEDEQARLAAALKVLIGTPTAAATAPSVAQAMALAAVKHGLRVPGAEFAIRSQDWASSIARQFLQGLTPDDREKYTQKIAETIEAIRRGHAASDAPAQRGFDVGDPVEHSRGEFVHEETDLVVRGAGLDFAFHRTYRHQSVGTGPLGHRWSFGYHMRLRVDDLVATLYTGTGRQEIYVRHARWPDNDFAYYVPPDGVDATLEPIGSAQAPTGWSRRAPDGLRHIFLPDPGWSGAFLLARIEDRWGNYLAFTHTTPVSGVARIERCEVNHPARWVQFAYDEHDRIIRVTDHTGRAWRYRYDAHGDLITTTTPATPDQPRGATTEYRYSSREHTGPLAHLLTDIFDAEGRHYLHTIYGVTPGQDDYNRVVKQRLGTGDYWFRYEPVRDPDLSLAPEDRPTMRCWLKERNGHQTLYVYDGWGSLLWKEETDKGPGHASRRVAWHYRYNRDGALTASRTPEGRVTHVLTGRDHFFRENNIAPNSDAAAALWTNDHLTADVRRGFGRVLATVQRAAVRTNPVSSWAERWGDVYAVEPGDLVVRHTYELEYGQPLTTSDPRATTHSDPRTLDADEPPAFTALLTRYEYANTAQRELLRVVSPAPTAPTVPVEPPGDPVVTEVLARDARGRVTRVRDSVGTEVVTTYEPDSSAAPYAGFARQIVVDPGGLALTTQHELDDLGRVVRSVLPRAVGAPAGHFVVEQEFDALDRVVCARRATPLATETRTHYESAGKPKETLTDWVDADGAPRGVIGRRWRYDEEHRVVRETFGSADVRDHVRIAHNYNAAGLRTVTVAPNDNNVQWRYDARDQVSHVIHGAGVGESIETFVRDKDGRVIEHRSAEGRTTRTTYDAFGRVVAVTDALGHVTRTSYDAGGRPTVVRVFERQPGSTAFALLTRVETVYDELGRAVRGIASQFETPPAAVTEAELPTAYEAAVVGVAVETRTFYDAAGRVVKVVDPLGNAATTEYDAAGRVVRVKDPTGNEVLTTYDAHGNAVRVDRVDRVFDLTGEVVGQEVFTSTAEYDARDRKVRQVDGLGNVTLFAYDSLDRLVRTTDPLGNVTTRDFDVHGNLIAVRTQRTATGEGGGTELAEHVVRHEYDPAGVMKARIDARGKRTEYRHDKWDRVVEEVLPDGARLATQYDRDSLVIAVRDAHGVVVRTQYDALARPVRTIIDTAEVDAGVTIEGNQQIDRAYDALGRARTASNEACSVAATYDSLGRVLAESTTLLATGATRTVARQYDLAGRRTGLTYPDGRELAYTHDAAGRLRSIQHTADGLGYPGAPGLVRTIARYAYAGSRQRSATFANGTETTWRHDARGGVIEVLHTGPSGTLLRVQQLRDGARAPRTRYQQMGSIIRQERLGYDSRYQLAARLDVVPAAVDVTLFGPPATVPVGTPPARQSLIDAAIGTRLGPTAPTGAEGWTYDLTGNRTVTTTTNGTSTSYGVADDRDRYGSIGGVSRTYDRAGNLTSDGTHRYIYDGLRRLVRVETISTGATVVRYDHDPAGRRVVEQRPGAPVVTCWYDGPDRIADYRGPTCVGQYVHGPGIDDPVELAAAGAHHTYHLDPQGSVRALSAADGTAATHLRFDPFGNTLSFSGGAHLAVPGTIAGASAATQPFGHASRPYDAATLTYDARARVYVPAIGRFLQRDPAGPVDGHLYAYAGNHPLAFGDPSGLARESIDRTQTRAGTRLRKVAWEKGLYPQDMDWDALAQGVEPKNVGGLLPAVEQAAIGSGQKLLGSALPGWARNGLTFVVGVGDGATEAMMDSPLRDHVLGKIDKRFVGAGTSKWVRNNTGQGDIVKTSGGWYIGGKIVGVIGVTIATGRVSGVGRTGVITREVAGTTAAGGTHSAVPLLTRADGKTMLGEALGILKDTPATQRADLARDLLGQIEARAVGGAWRATEMGAAGGGRAWVGETHTLVVDATGTLFVGPHVGGAVQFGVVEGQLGVAGWSGLRPRF